MVGLTSIFFVSCEDNFVSFSNEDRTAVDSIVRSTSNIDSLSILQKRFEQEGNILGSIVAYRELGRVLRDESRFDEALNIHIKCLKQAEFIRDTLEWVQALNNIGTNYRRMGVLDVAHDYHYRAKMLGEESSDTSLSAKRNHVVSLNGLGNVYMTLGNYERADTILRQALHGEKMLNGLLGQAINNANRGYIFEQKGQIDSAWVYYRRSMSLNQEIGSVLGISLCHTHFGSLYEKSHQYDKAVNEYNRAYELMYQSKDEWHAINPLISLAGVYYAVNDIDKAFDYLNKAKRIAERIHSHEHFAEIYTLYYKCYKRKGNYKEALAFHENTTAMLDSVIDINKVNRIQNSILFFERSKQKQQLDEARLKFEQERKYRYFDYGIFATVLLLLGGTIGMMLYIYRLRAHSHRELKRLSRLREDFFTNITQEFRTPLTVILGLSRDIQKNEELPDELKDKMKMIERQGNGLLTLISQLLDISKLKLAIGNAEWTNGNITAYLTMIVETYSSYANKRNIDLHFFARETIVLDFVPDYLNKVMNNLLSNALKFTPDHGKISVEVQKSKSHLLITVADTGVGMTKEIVSHIFEPFYQADDKQLHLETKIGLALVKQIIDAIGGTITVDSAIGAGTTFSISIPIINKNQTVNTETGETNIPILQDTGTLPADSENVEHSCRLLIVEDNYDIATYIGSQLSKRYDICYASNGVEGLERALAIVPDLIITDQMMPVMDGLELCNKLQRNKVTDHIPIIMLTAKNSEEDRMQIMESGADVFLIKPFNADELRMQVDKLLEKHYIMRRKYAQLVSMEEKNIPEDNIDNEHVFLKQLSDAIYNTMIRGFVDVNTVASELCMSPGQLRRKLYAITGETPMAHIKKLQMLTAKKLLVEKPDMSINDISFKCGYANQTHFTRAFKSMFGLTPMQWRKQKRDDI